MELKKTITLLNNFNSRSVEQLSQLFIDAVTQSRLNFKTKTTLDNYIIHNYLSVAFSFSIVG